MHIHPAGVKGPAARLLLRARRRQLAGVVLLDLDLLHRKARPLQRPQQLVAVETQCLQPLGMAGPHGEAPPLQAQRTAVLGQLRAGDPRPGLPERGQVAIVPPVVLQLREHRGQALGWPRRRRQQQGHLTLPPALVAGCNRHRAMTVGDVRQSRCLDAATLASL